MTPERVVIPWRCHAKPAALGGKTCGRLNTEARALNFHGSRLEYCEACGCTKVASDLRAQARSTTYEGIATAMADQWGPLLRSESRAAA